MKEFTTIAYLLSYPGMIVAVILLTQAFKKLFGITGRDKIQWVVLAWAAIFCVVAALFQGDFSDENAAISTILVWFVNMFIVWFAAMKAFEKTAGESVDGVLELDQTDEDTDKFNFNLGDNLGKLPDMSYIKLKIDRKV